MAVHDADTHNIGVPRTRQDEIVVGWLDVAKVPSDVSYDIRTLERWRMHTAPISLLLSVLALSYHVICGVQA